MIPLILLRWLSPDENTCIHFSPLIFGTLSTVTLSNYISSLFVLGSKRHCQAEEEHLIEKDRYGNYLEGEVDTVEHSEMDDQSTGCEELEKESPEDPTEDEGEENRNNKDAQKRKRQKLIKDKVNMVFYVCVFFQKYICDCLCLSNVIVHAHLSIFAGLVMHILLLAI